MTKHAILTLLFALLTVGAAEAGTFKIEAGVPPVTIAVPDSWNPNSSEDGVDCIAPDNTVSLSLYDAKAKDAAAAAEDALGILTRNGIKLDRNSAETSAVSLAGLKGTATQYSASEDGKPRQVKIAIAQVSGGRYLQLLQWGTAEGAKKNAAALKKISDSIKVK
jgi:hypothetical protein